MTDNTPNPKKVLIFKLSAIGDVILSGYSFQTIKALWPSSQVTLMTSHRTAPLLLNNKSVDIVWAVDEMIFWRKKLIPLCRLFLAMKSESYEAVYIMHWSPIFHWFFWMMGIPQRIGFERDGRSWRLTRKQLYSEGENSPHDVFQYLSLVTDKKLQVSQILDHSPLQYTSDEIEQFDLRHKEWSGGDIRPWIAISPGGGNNPKLVMPQKRWPANSFAEFIRALQKKMNVLVFVLGDDSEKDLLGSSPGVINLCGVLNLREIGLLLKKCKLFVGNDSGLLHMAGAIGTTTLSFFGPTSPDGKVPIWAPHFVMYRQEDCSPCYRYGYAPPCPYELKCLVNISVSEAIDRAITLLESSDEAAHAS